MFSSSAVALVVAEAAEAPSAGFPVMLMIGRWPDFHWPNFRSPTGRFGQDFGEVLAAVG